MAISIIVAYRGVVYPIQLALSATLVDLHAQLEQLTSVPPLNQKLIYKGRRVDSALADTGFKDGMKFQMLGSTSQQVSAISAADDEHAKSERIMRGRALKPQVKVRSVFLIPSIMHQ